MKHIGLVLGLLVLFNGANAQSQSTDTKQALPTKTAPKPKPSTTNAEFDVDVKERRARARSLLVSLSTDARTFRDQTLRARSLARIADALWQVDSEQARLLFRKAWEAAQVVDEESDRKLQDVKAANSAEGFTGEDGELLIRFQSKGHASISNKYVADFNLDGIFRDLAVQDYDQAVELARGFQAKGPRAVATIAIARAILQPKKDTVSQ